MRETEQSATCDYLIVGAGTAGCVLAARLSEDGRHSVCVLESGPSARSPYLHVPGGFIKAVANPRYTFQYKTLPSAGTAGRTISIPQGRVIGGSSALNGLNYNRGRAQDFDDWEAAGNRGWSYAEILPYFKRTEFRVGCGDPRYRGTDGPLPVTDCSWRHPLCDAFLAAAEQLGLGANPDYNGATQAGAGYFQRIIEGRWRVSAATAFLSPARRRPNLRVRTGTHVVAIDVANGRAAGVRYDGRHGRGRIAVRREVILCAGAANSPKLLQISGIGPAALLNRLGIPVVCDLAGVGENLRDHYVIRSVARVRGVKTINDLSRGARLLFEVAKWAVGRPSILTISPSVMFGYCASSEAVSSPDIMLVFTPGSFKASVSGLLDDFPGLTLGFGQMRPRSRGFVRAVSGDFRVAPAIQPNYLAEPGDRRVVVDALRLSRRMLAAPPLARYIEAVMTPPPALEADDELLDFARGNGNTSYHLVGTCKMGPASDPAAVVDDALRVRRIAGLRVVDASIMPDIPSANTMAAVLAIAEKGADLILGRSLAPEAISFSHHAPATA